MNEGERCPECGGRLKAGSGNGLCARCLLAVAMRHPGAAPDNFPGAGDRIGSYRIAGPLGEGGMGVVYLAEQEQPLARQVAIKIIKLGMDTRAVLTRFQSEEQALAMMDHPNIAQVYEAGSTAEGRPYFVMEYVPGVPITEYCDRHRLDTRRRLQLFLQVVNAVQHAHQKGVIHRDLKPSNVLVMERDGEAVPKIIDFGLAKATEKDAAAETAFTEAGVIVGTPEYMSPEQASSARDIDTRTDIYSLGVLLYELLVGALPFEPKALRAAGYEEIRRIIRETDPPRPATRFDSLGPAAAEVASCRATDARGLRRELAGDLEWITLKTLEKDCSRRYASVSDLAEDIRRRLAGEPVVAAPPGAIYHLRKFAARHVPEIAAAGVVFCALLAALALSTAYYLRSEYERELIERRNYQANLGAAEDLLNLNQSAPARKLLLACAPRRRSWEWRHLWSRSESGTSGVLRQPQEPIAAMSVGLRTDSIALGLESGAVEILARDGAVAQRWQAHDAVIRALALSPDGKLLLTAASDPTLRLWDVPTHRVTAELALPAPAVSAAFGPAGRAFAVALTNGAAEVWRVDSRSRSVEIHTNQALDTVSFIPDASGLATTGGGWLRLWNLPGGAQRHSFPDSVPATFSPDGMFVLSAVSLKKEARVWNARTGGFWGALHVGTDVVAGAMCPSADRIAIAASDGSLQFWEATYHDRVLTLPIEPGVRSIVFTGHGDRLLGLYPREVRVWDTRATRPAPKSQPGEASISTPSVWKLFLEMLGGGVFVSLFAWLLFAALFRRRQFQAAMDRLLTRIPPPPMPLWAARSGYWAACVAGFLFVLLFLALAIGEGMPRPSRADIRYDFGFLGFWVIAAGLILAWKWEGWGGLCALAGYVILVAFTPAALHNPIILGVAIIGLIHISCWARLRSGANRARPI